MEIYTSSVHYLIHTFAFCHEIKFVLILMSNLLKFFPNGCQLTQHCQLKSVNLSKKQTKIRFDVKKTNTTAGHAITAKFLNKAQHKNKTVHQKKRKHCKKKDSSLSVHNNSGHSKKNKTPRQTRADQQKPNKIKIKTPQTISNHFFFKHIVQTKKKVKKKH